MIKKLLQVMIKTVGIFIKGPGPFLPLMLPGGRQVEVAELETHTNLPHLRDLNRMIRNLPTPDEEGLKITLVGQGFCGDVIAHDGSWHLAKGFQFKVKQSWIKKPH